MLTSPQSSRSIFPSSDAITSSLDITRRNAVRLLREAVQLSEKDKLPDNPDIHYHLGLAYEKTDQPALARQQLQRVLKINPNYSGAADVKRELAQLKS